MEPSPNLSYSSKFPLSFAELQKIRLDRDWLEDSPASSPSPRPRSNSDSKKIIKKITKNAIQTENILLRLSQEKNIEAKQRLQETLRELTETQKACSLLLKQIYSNFFNESKAVTIPESDQEDAMEIDAVAFRCADGVFTVSKGLAFSSLFFFKVMTAGEKGKQMMRLCTLERLQQIEQFSQTNEIEAPLDELYEIYLFAMKHYLWDLTAFTLLSIRQKFDWPKALKVFAKDPKSQNQFMVQLTSHIVMNAKQLLKHPELLGFLNQNSFEVILESDLLSLTHEQILSLVNIWITRQPNLNETEKKALILKTPLSEISWTQLFEMISKNKLSQDAFAFLTKAKQEADLEASRKLIKPRLNTINHGTLRLEERDFIVEPDCTAGHYYYEGQWVVDKTVLLQADRKVTSPTFRLSTNSLDTTLFKIVLQAESPETHGRILLILKTIGKNNLELRHSYSFFKIGSTELERNKPQKMKNKPSYSQRLSRERFRELSKFDEAKTIIIGLKIFFPYWRKKLLTD